MLSELALARVAILGQVSCIVWPEAMLMSGR